MHEPMAGGEEGAPGAGAKDAIPLLRKQIEKYARVTGFREMIEDFIRTIEAAK